MSIDLSALIIRASGWFRLSPLEAVLLIAALISLAAFSVLLPGGMRAPW